jgi:hypothetical protein
MYKNYEMKKCRFIDINTCPANKCHINKIYYYIINDSNAYSHFIYSKYNDFETYMFNTTPENFQSQFITEKEERKIKLEKLNSL